MLRALTYSAFFSFLRLILISVEAVIYVSTLKLSYDIIQSKVMAYVPELFGLIVTPMSVVIGLGIGSLLVKLLSLVYYYIKLANIIAITMGSLGYLPYDENALTTSFKQSISNFTSLTVIGTATSGAAQVFKSIKEQIMELDYVKSVTGSDKTIVKLLAVYINKTLYSLLDLIDEIIISYTWYTTNLYIRSKGEDKVKAKDRMKKQSLFMLEGIAFMTAIFPKMLINTVIIEFTLFVFARVLALVCAVSVTLYLGVGFYTIGIGVISYMIASKVIRTVLLDTGRLVFYIYLFYWELSKLDDFDVLGKVASLVGLVPGLDNLVKKSGIELPQPNGESSLFQFKYKEEFKDTLKDLAQVFGVDVGDWSSQQNTDSNEEFTLRARNDSEKTTEVQGDVEDASINDIKLDSEDGSQQENIKEAPIDNVEVDVDDTVSQDDLFGDSPMRRREGG